jgi:hypothetical protein
MSILALGPTHVTIPLVQGALASGVKQPECETDHLPAFIAEVENECSYTFTHHVCLCDMCGVNYTFAFCLMLHKQKIKAGIARFNSGATEIQFIVDEFMN